MKLSIQDKQIIKNQSERQTNFSDLLNELLEDENKFPSGDWKTRFFGRMKGQVKNGVK